MGLDYKKLEEANKRFDKESKEEIFKELPVELIHFLNNEVANHVLCKMKYSKSDHIPARVLNNWIKEEVVNIDAIDKGKIKRFNKIQCIWLDVVEEARKYGMYLEDLKRTHDEIMTSPIPNFSYLKLAVINTILSEAQVMELSHSGSCNIRSEIKYRNKKTLPPHAASCIVFYLSLLIQKEFPKANFKLPIEIENYISDEEKMLLLFLLKTSSYKHMKIYLSEADVRLLEDSETVIKNVDLYQAISSWKFKKIEIYLEDGTLTIIENNQ